MNDETLKFLDAAQTQVLYALGDRNRLLLAGDDGLHTLASDGDRQPVDLSALEPFDELLFLAESEQLLAVDSSGTSGPVIRCMLIGGGTAVRIYRGEQPHPDAAFLCSFSQGATLWMAYSTPAGDTILDAYLVDGDADEQLKPTRTLQRSERLGEGATPIGVWGEGVAWLVDKGPLGRAVSVFDASGQEIFAIPKLTCWGTSSGELWCGEQAEGTNRLWRFGHHGFHSFSLPGRPVGVLPLEPAGLTAEAVLLASSGDETIVRVGPDGASPVLQPVELGRTFLVRPGGLAVTGTVVSGPRMLSWGRQHAGAEALDRGWRCPDVGRTKHTLHSPEGARAMVLMPESRQARSARGVFLHFHGGPDAYEVEEPRLFGLFRSLLLDGWTVASLNYRGSVSANAAHHAASWGRWRETLTQDFDWLCNELSSPVTAVGGWSFGGTVAMALAARRTSITKVISGGAMYSLIEQRAAARAEDARHEQWFSSRFAPADEEFFEAGQHARSSVDVLSFHGREDLQCPYTQLAPAREAWLAAGANWCHFDLPAGNHAPTGSSDALLIRQEAERLLLVPGERVESHTKRKTPER